MYKKYLLLVLGFVFFKLSAQQKTIDSTASEWKFSVWADYFIIPGEKNFINPTFYARYKSLHLEGRYNYEDMNTTSLFAGWKLTTGKAVQFVFVPMVGIVFGNTNGIAPGLELEIMYKKFDFYSESEHLLDFSGKENNFFYMYSELAFRPIKPIRTGLIAQRTKLFESDREFQRGIFGEYYFGRCRAGIYFFSPFANDNFLILNFSVDF